MRYIQPKITNTLKATSVILGGEKMPPNSETEVIPTTTPAYTANE
jgi:hypothetical protein